MNLSPIGKGRHAVGGRRIDVLIGGALYIVARDASARTGCLDIGQVDAKIGRQLLRGRRSVDAPAGISAGGSALASRGGRAGRRSCRGLHIGRDQGGELVV